MHTRHRATIILSLLVLALFIARWPLDDYLCNPAQWQWRPARNEDLNFFRAVFSGGGGTPAVFAMLGGQRYMVANIMWTYADVLFHQGKLDKMIPPMESTVTLNPSFTEAWSTYQWHLAWNMYAAEPDPILKMSYLEKGVQVNIRAIKANPDKPTLRFNLAWLYWQRLGNYRKAIEVLEPIVFPGKNDLVFPPLTQAIRKQHPDDDDFTDQHWDPLRIGHSLADLYRNAAYCTGDSTYLEKAIKTYQQVLIYFPDDKLATQKIKDFTHNLHNRQWMLNQRVVEDQYRQNWGLPRLEYDKSLDKIFPDVSTGINALTKK